MLLSTKEMIGVKKDTFPSDGMETNSDQSECAIGMHYNSEYSNMVNPLEMNSSFSKVKEVVQFEIIPGNVFHKKKFRKSKDSVCNSSNKDSNAIDAIVRCKNSDEELLPNNISCVSSFENLRPGVNHSSETDTVNTFVKTNSCIKKQISLDDAFRDCLIQMSDSSLDNDDILETLKNGSTLESPTNLYNGKRKILHSQNFSSSSNSCNSENELSFDVKKKKIRKTKKMFNSRIRRQKPKSRQEIAVGVPNIFTDQSPEIEHCKKTLESFLQKGLCLSLPSNIDKCIECRAYQTKKNLTKRDYDNITCRFYAFRQLRFKNSEQLIVAGFPNPYKDYKDNDLHLWLPAKLPHTPSKFDFKVAKKILEDAGGQFCRFVQDENEASGSTFCRSKQDENEVSDDQFCRSEQDENEVSESHFSGSEQYENEASNGQFSGSEQDVNEVPDDQFCRSEQDENEVPNDQFCRLEQDENEVPDDQFCRSEQDENEVSESHFSGSEQYENEASNGQFSGSEQDENEAPEDQFCRSEQDENEVSESHFSGSEQYENEAFYGQFYRFVQDENEASDDQFYRFIQDENEAASGQFSRFVQDENEVSDGQISGSEQNENEVSDDQFYRFVQDENEVYDGQVSGSEQNENEVSDDQFYRFVQDENEVYDGQVSGSEQDENEVSDGQVSGSEQNENEASDDQVSGSEQNENEASDDQFSRFVQDENEAAGGQVSGSEQDENEVSDGQVSGSEQSENEVSDGQFSRYVQDENEAAGGQVSGSEQDENEVSDGQVSGSEQSENEVSDGQFSRLVEEENEASGGYFYRFEQDENEVSSGQLYRFEQGENEVSDDQVSRSEQVKNMPFVRKFVNEKKNCNIAWKKSVNGIREMCDVCKTTIFNHHWVCSKCGFVVCVDCYRVRALKNASTKNKNDDDLWLLCSDREEHRVSELTFTQIVAGNALNLISEFMHRFCTIFNIHLDCECNKKYDKVPSKMINPLTSLLLNDECNRISRRNRNNRRRSSSSSSDIEKSSYLRDLIDNNCEQNTSDNEKSSSHPNDSNDVDSHKEGVCYTTYNDAKNMCTPVLSVSLDTESDAPHMWLCDGRLLRLLDPKNEANYDIFQKQWKRGQPVLISRVGHNLKPSLWHPKSFSRDFGKQKNDLINCTTGDIVPNQPMSKFWDGFENAANRLRDKQGNVMFLKLKDWPPSADFAETLPDRFEDLMNSLPLKEYTHRDGRFNLASHLPEGFVRPDLGPKMYTAYGNAGTKHKMLGTTNLHLDISDAVNVMVFVAITKNCKDFDYDWHVKKAFEVIEEAGCDDSTKRRVYEEEEIPGALWHIYHASEADSIRDFLNKVAVEQGIALEKNHDPIHDQTHYLDAYLRDRLYKEYGVKGYPIVQCFGDAVFIPAGAPHQVRNLHNCIKVAEDFVSPENVHHSFRMTQEFRHLSDNHTNHEDKLQIKNIVFHAIKHSLSTLMNNAYNDDLLL